MKQTALISGGTSGLGLQLAKELVEKGYRVYAFSRNKNRIEELKKLYNGITFVHGDVTDKHSLNNIYSIISNEIGCLDLLVNNAGIIYPGGIEQLELDDWHKMFNINVTGVFLLVQVMLPLLKMSNNASIINVSSISSQMTGSSIAYSACKAAVDMMTKSMAKEFAKYKIRVNSVNPGMLSTGFQIHNNMIDECDYDGFLEKVGRTYPLGIGDPSDVAKLIIFLSSKDANWITGSNYIIDGGKSVDI